MKGNLSFNHKRGLVRFLKGSIYTRLWFIRTLMDVPLLYLHEISHLVVCLFFSMSPKLRIQHILKTVYSFKSKQNVTYAYSASVSYNNHLPKSMGNIASYMISIAPYFFTCILSILIIELTPQIISVLWILYITYCKRGWYLSDQDIHQAHLDIKWIKYDISTLLNKYKYTIIKTLNGNNVSKNKETIRTFSKRSE